MTIPKPEFTTDDIPELQEKVEEYAGLLREDPTQPKLVGKLATALSVLDDLTATLPEDTAIELEAWRSGIALDSYSVVAESLGRNPKTLRLRPFLDTPISDAAADRNRLQKEEARLRREESKKQKLEQIIGEIKEEEKANAITGKQLKQLKFFDPYAEPKQRDGKWLKHLIGTINDNGSEEKVFTADEAQVLAGHVLGSLDPGNLRALQDSIAKIGVLAQEANRLGLRHVPEGLFTAFGKLQELVESDGLQKHRSLRVLKEWVSLFEVSQDEAASVLESMVNIGPFANCERLPLEPFPPGSVEGSPKDTIIKIPKDLVTEENIMEDIQTAVGHSNGEYTVERQRVIEFIELKERLEHDYPGSVTVYRSLRANWHPMPRYIIEVSQDPAMAIVESPIYSNATYFINNGDWIGTLGFCREDARKLGAVPKVHSHNPRLKHIDKLHNLVKQSYGKAIRF